MMKQVTMVFKSGAVIEISLSEYDANNLLDDFYNDWDKPGVTINHNNIRIKADEVAGIVINS